MKERNINARRVAREVKTIEVMVGIYCQRNHHPEVVPCPECQDVLRYAKVRIDKCPFLSYKPTCANCTVHCFKPSYRQQVKQIMAFAGPRMSYLHPILTFYHFLDKFRTAPTRTRSKSSERQP